MLVVSRCYVLNGKSELRSANLSVTSTHALIVYCNPTLKCSVQCPEEMPEMSRDIYYNLHQSIYPSHVPFTEPPASLLRQRSNATSQLLLSTPNSPSFNPSHRPLSTAHPRSLSTLSTPCSLRIVLASSSVLDSLAWNLPEYGSNRSSTTRSAPRLLYTSRSTASGSSGSGDVAMLAQYSRTWLRECQVGKRTCEVYVLQRGAGRVCGVGPVRWVMPRALVNGSRGEVGSLDGVRRLLSEVLIGSSIRERD